ncbi:MAG: hypothetical protein WCW56_03220 [Candidatus Paceibacterota bacterium]|jgi:hypothetical protein
MPKNWSRGFTKETHPSLLKISQTMRNKKINNFAKWQETMRLSGKMKSNYPDFKKDGNLAELIGVVLGDGHIEIFPRTECLYVLSNSNNPGFIKRYSTLIEKTFQKEPTVTKMPHANCVRIRLYEKNISRRLGVPSGSRNRAKIEVPKWILKNPDFVVRYLRGLYEAEGSFCVHLPTCTYKFLFAGVNQSMLGNVFKLVEGLGFHPHMGKKQVQVSRKEEVYRLKELIGFRVY